jgi:NAD(P)-dependent dehydrogenase (short-subunit alcohol dehydrogenase family)
MTQAESRPKSGELPAQTLDYPGTQSDMELQPNFDMSNYRPADKLKDKVAIITGGDSGIGQAVAIAFAMEGADVAIVYDENDGDADTTYKYVTKHGRQCLKIKSDVGIKQECESAVAKTISKFGKIDILVNNAAFQPSQYKFEDIPEDQLRRIFEVDIIGYFFMAQAVLPHFQSGSTIVNTGSTTGLMGHPMLIDYSSTKGAIHTFTKSLALNLAEQKIRVNGVIPGPVWTPLIPGSSPDPDAVSKFGSQSAMQRPGQPEELAPAYVLLASSDSSFMTGSLVEVSGGILTIG